MADEMLSLRIAAGGISVYSNSDKDNDEGGLYLVSITPEGKLYRERSVRQERTNFEVDEEANKLRVR